MKKKLMFSGWFLLNVLFMIFTCSAPADEVPELFVPEQVFAFDPVWDGDTVVHEFVLVNKGAAPLEILKIEND